MHTVRKVIALQEVSSDEPEQKDLTAELRKFREGIMQLGLLLNWFYKHSGVPLDTPCLEPVAGEEITLRAYISEERTKLRSYGFMYRCSCPL